MDLRKFVAPECVFGVDARMLAASYASNIGARKVLIVTDPGVEAAGWTSDVVDGLKRAGLPYAVFDDVTPNPRAEEVMAGADVYLSENCNCIVAVGGGSPIDCAKGIGIVSTNKRHIVEFEGVDEVPFPIPPLICIPTTGGSSADVSQFAIINDMDRRVKIAIISKAILPDVALIDPVTLTTMPSELTSNTGIDTLSHAIEAYVSNAQSAVTDVLALEAIRLVTQYLAATVSDPLNVDLRSKISVACMDAGLAFSNAGLGIVHAMSHSLGGELDMPHGKTNSILLRHSIPFNFPLAGERYRQIGEAMGLDLADKDLDEVESVLVTELKRLDESVGITGGLADEGICLDDIPNLAGKAMDDPDIATNPREPGLRDIEEIYERAL